MDVFKLWEDVGVSRGVLLQVLWNKHSNSAQKVLRYNLKKEFCFYVVTLLTCHRPSCQQKHRVRPYVVCYCFSLLSFLSPACLGGTYHGFLPLAHSPGQIYHLPLINLVYWSLFKAVTQGFSSLDR